MHPNSMVLTLPAPACSGSAGSASTAAAPSSSSALAASAFTATQAAAAAAGLSWMLVEWLHRGKPTALGLASGMVAGLVAVTPASGFVLPWAGLAIGLIAGVVCYARSCLSRSSIRRLARRLWRPWRRRFPRRGPDRRLLLKMDDRQPSSGPGLLAGSAAQARACNSSPRSLRGLGLRADAGAGQGHRLGAGLRRRRDAEENEGLDRTEHGEVGFDFGPAMELRPPTRPRSEPRAAIVPPVGQGPFHSRRRGGRPTATSSTPGRDVPARRRSRPSEFQAVYPYVTTVQGNRFRSAAATATTMREHARNGCFRTACDGRAGTVSNVMPYRRRHALSDACP